MQLWVQEAALFDGLKPVIEVDLDIVDRAREDLVLEHSVFHEHAAVLTPHDHFHRVLTRRKDIYVLFHVEVVAERDVQGAALKGHLRLKPIRLIIISNIYTSLCDQF